MKALLALLLLVAPAARADLYRWIDPQTGSVKFSNLPPPASQPGVEVLPYGRNARAPAPAGSAAAALELRWRELLAEVSQPPASPSAREAIQRRLQDLAAAAAELDRVDPQGTPRRRAEVEGVLGRLQNSPP